MWTFTYRYLQKNSAMDHVDPVALLHGAARSSMEVARARTTGALDRPWLWTMGGPLGTYETMGWPSRYIQIVEFGPWDDRIFVNSKIFSIISRHELLQLDLKHQRTQSKGTTLFAASLSKAYLCYVGVFKLDNISKCEPRQIPSSSFLVREWQQAIRTLREQNPCVHKPA